MGASADFNTFYFRWFTRFSISRKMEISAPYSNNLGFFITIVKRTKLGRSYFCQTRRRILSYDSLKYSKLCFVKYFMTLGSMNNNWILIVKENIFGVFYETKICLMLYSSVKFRQNTSICRKWIGKTKFHMKTYLKHSVISFLFTDIFTYSKHSVISFLFTDIFTYSKHSVISFLFTDIFTYSKHSVISILFTHIFSYSKHSVISQIFSPIRNILLYPFYLQIFSPIRNILLYPFYLQIFSPIRNILLYPFYLHIFSLEIKFKMCKIYTAFQIFFANVECFIVDYL